MSNHLNLSRIDGDLYIGKGAGKEIMTCFNQSKQTIKIVSPYVNKDYVQKLIKQHQAGIATGLVFTWDYKQGQKANQDLAHTLFTQTRIKSDEALRKKRMGRFIALGWCFVNFIILAHAITLKGTVGFWFEMIAVVALFTANFKYFDHVHKTPIYSYSYEPNMPISIWKTNRYQKLHTKLYVVDDVAFIGSLNFTKNGFYSNYESCMSIHKKDEVIDLHHYIDSLLNDKECQQFYFNEIGKQYFEEPAY
ncbi:phospholipase D family protein [Erysipelothrix rhusiopathiae]|uniref:phospholipase D-like domain-containing protein n=1 Tax=Erysipelothrix rhusiopathiae TaxID=1648 RepID=UPI001EDF721D|nr:phospholipase D family protein [Erysipelothrix rhusiopathiae]